MRRTDQLKGIIISYPSNSPEVGAMTLIFIDLFYYYFPTDMLMEDFNLMDPQVSRQWNVPDWPQRWGEIEMERLTWKYVKYLNDSKGMFQPFLTYGPEMTLELRFGVNEALKLQESKIKAHACPHSTFSLDRYIFCFHKRVK